MGKDGLNSTTIRSGIVMAIALLVNLGAIFGFDIGSADVLTKALLAGLDGLVAVLGVWKVISGRINATEPITSVAGVGVK